MVKVRQAIGLILITIVLILIYPSSDSKDVTKVTTSHKSLPTETVQESLKRRNNSNIKVKELEKSSEAVLELADVMHLDEASPVASVVNDDIPETVEAEEKVRHAGVFSNEDLSVLAGSGAKVEVLGNNQNSGLIPYARGNSRASTSNSNQRQASASPSPSPSASQSEFTPVYGQARGYAMLYLMHPKARATVEAEIDNMIRSNVRELYLSVLTDGTFTQDYDYLNYVISRLNAAADRVILSIYLTNGPTQRSFDETPIDAPFVRTDPVIFREQIQYDQNIREQFRKLVKAAIPSFTLNTSLSPLNQNIAIVMLEDNLDSLSYKAMREIASQEIGNLANFVRNPCECYQGSDTYSFGDPIEHHEFHLIPLLGQGGGFTLDGIGIKHIGESALGADSATIERSISQGIAQRIRYYGLWRNQRQGIYGASKVHPNLRNYEVPTKAQSDVEIKLLRHGLKELEDSSSTEQ